MESTNDLLNMLRQIHEEAKKHPQNEYANPLSESDIQMNLFLENYISMNDADRKNEENKIDRELAGRLFSHSRKIATYVLNHPMEGQMLKMAITALSLAERMLDFRDILTVLALVFDSASRAGVDLLSLASEEECSVLKLREFDDRPPEHKTIECMGFTLKYEDGKLYYFRTW